MSGPSAPPSAGHSPGTAVAGRDVLTIVLAGGKGSRLEPLTRDRAKPAVPFGGCYRILDFALSNCLNSGLRRIYVLTQYKAASLDRHIRQTWQFLCRELDEFIDLLPPQQRIDESWYQGTADAVYQNIYSIEQHRPRYVLVLSGDHIYTMNYAALLERHAATGADLTIGCLPVPLEEGRGFGVMGVDGEGRVVRFDEKPDSPMPLPHDPERCLASMGIYVFNAEFLYEQLCLDATQADSSRDFGHNIIPRLIGRHEVRTFPFENADGSQRYWRDVGTLDSYYEACMDLVSVDPQLNLYDPAWPIRCYQPIAPPPKFVFAADAPMGGEPEARRVGTAIDSLVCSGSILSGGSVVRSILSPNVRINSYAQVEDSILLDRVDVGRHARVRRAIIDKGVRIAEGATVGYDAEADRAAGYTVTESGLTVVGRTDVPA